MPSLLDPIPSKTLGWRPRVYFVTFSNFHKKIKMFILQLSICLKPSTLLPYTVFLLYSVLGYKPVAGEAFLFFLKKYLSNWTRNNKIMVVVSSNKLQVFAMYTSKLQKIRVSYRKFCLIMPIQNGRILPLYISS